LESSGACLQGTRADRPPGRRRIIEICRLRNATNNQPVPGGSARGVRRCAAKDVADKKGARHLIGRSIIDCLITRTSACSYARRCGNCKLLGPDITSIGGLPKGRIRPHPPENAVTTTSLGFAGFTVIDVSPSLKASVFVRLGSVLLTTGSTIKTAGRSGIGLVPLVQNPQEPPGACRVWCPVVRLGLILLPSVVDCSDLGQSPLSLRMNFLLITISYLQLLGLSLSLLVFSWLRSSLFARETSALRV